MVSWSWTANVTLAYVPRVLALADVSFCNWNILVTLELHTDIWRIQVMMLSFILHR